MNLGNGWISALNIKTEVYPERNLRWHVITGALNKEDLLRELGKLYSAEYYDQNMNALWDLRKTDFSRITADDVHEVAEYVQDTEKDVSNYKTALVASNELAALGYGVAQMYALLMSSKNHGVVQVFLTVEAAEEWLDEDMEKS